MLHTDVDGGGGDDTQCCTDVDGGGGDDTQCCTQMLMVEVVTTLNAAHRC